jgi:hypothetical protein
VFTIAEAGSALSASGAASASFGGAALAATSLAASGEGNAAFVKSGHDFAAFGEGSTTFAGIASVNAAIAALGEGSSAFHGSALAESAPSAYGVGLAAFAGSSIPPVIARQIIRTSYFLTFTDTETEEATIIPASSLSISSRSGNPSSINAVIPYTFDHANTIASATNALIEIHRAQTYCNGQTSTALIEYGDVTSIRSDIGGRNASITLTASSTKTNRATKYVTMHGISYVSVIDGKMRIRCTPSNDLAVGDTVHIDTYTLVANNIQLNVTATLEQMEVYE